jgi:acetylglutamate kinase
MVDEDALRHVLLDIVFMETVGMRPVIVHGAGPAINAAMEKAGIAPNFVHGRRVTDQATLSIVQDVLAGNVNRQIAELIEDVGGRAMTLNFDSTPVLFGEPLELVLDGDNVDLGFVGQVTRIDQAVIDNLCYAGTVPIIPSMCTDEQGQVYNVNADSAATMVARLLGAEKLIFLSDVNGVREDKDDPSTLIASLSTERAHQLIADGAIDAGMIPKVEACIETLDRGVRKVHIIDGRIRHSLLLEIYTSQGIGTQIIK